MIDADHVTVLRRLLAEGPDDDGQERFWDVERTAIERAIEKLNEPNPDWSAIERKVEKIINTYLNRLDIWRLAADIVAALP